MIPAPMYPGGGEIIRRIGRDRASPIDNGRIVVRHIDRIGLGRLNDDDLLALLLFLCDLLLLGRRQLVVGIGLRAQPLDGVHHVRLLGQDRVAELLRPVKLRAHHCEDIRRGNQRFHAVIPRLLVHRGLQFITFEVLVFLHPAIGLHDLQRIGRCHQDQGQQSIRIQRDRRN